MVEQPSPEFQADLARRNRRTAGWLVLVIVACSSISWFAKELLLPVFFKW